MGEKWEACVATNHVGTHIDTKELPLDGAA